MKNIFKNILFASLACTMSLTSCTDYLEQDEEAVLSKEDAFKNFRSFQGFVEVMPNLIPDLAKSYWVSSFNWGEDEIITTGNGEYLMGFQIDGGNYRSYIGAGHCFLDRSWSISGDRFNKSIWGGSWYAIRQCNMGLQALDEGLLTDATKEERDIIKGQLLFWRGWFYFQLTTYWGGLPYMTRPLESNEPITLPRETYAENAEKMAADFEEAAKLLPLDWDKSCAPGAATKGNNDFRPNKIWAEAYLGKCLLYAASPLMQNGPYTKGDTYQYNATLAKKAAEALGNVLKQVEAGDTRYALVDFADYHTLFWTKEQNWLMPGGTEAIMRSPTFGADSYWRQMNSYQIADICEGDGIILCPTANYINYAYGMANGEPIVLVENGSYVPNPNSGFDQTHPWKGRDPRFYNDIMYDGRQMVKSPSTDSGKKYQYANFYNGGNGVENPQKTSRSAYLNYKFIPIGANTDDADYGYGKATHLHLSWMRLAEVYLLYAEALAASDGANATAGGFAKTAAEAVNTVRARAGVEGVAAEFTGDKNKFMDEVRRERAVELAFEGHRFNDLRRWKLLAEKPYTLKTMQKFDRASELDPTVDPSENAVKNWSDAVLVERNYGPKHYWLPFSNDDVQIYPEFNQNPGW